jgi:hypothetical protein
VTVSNATVTPGSNPGATAQRDGSGPPAISANGKEVTVNLKNVSNAQTLAVNLIGVSGIGDVSVPMAVLQADVNQSGGVNSGDVFLVQQQNGQAVPAADFRRDTNLNGFIDSGDLFIAQKQNPSALP